MITQIESLITCVGILEVFISITIVSFILDKKRNKVHNTEA